MHVHAAAAAARLLIYRPSPRSPEGGCCSPSPWLGSPRGCAAGGGASASRRRWCAAREAAVPPLPPLVACALSNDHAYLRLLTRRRRPRARHAVCAVGAAVCRCVAAPLQLFLANAALCSGGKTGRRRWAILRLATVRRPLRRPPSASRRCSRYSLRSSAAPMTPTCGRAPRSSRLSSADGHLQSAYKGEGFFYDVRRARRRRRRPPPPPPLYVPDDDEIELGGGGAPVGGGDYCRTPATDEVAVLYDAEQLIKTAPARCRRRCRRRACRCGWRGCGWWRRRTAPSPRLLPEGAPAEAASAPPRAARRGELRRPRGAPVRPRAVGRGDRRRRRLELGADADTELLLLIVGPDGPIPPDDVCLHADLAEMRRRSRRAPTRSPGPAAGADGEPVTEPI